MEPTRGDLKGDEILLKIDLQMIHMFKKKKMYFFIFKVINETSQPRILLLIDLVHPEMTEVNISRYNINNYNEARLFVKKYILLNFAKGLMGGLKA